MRDDSSDEFEDADHAVVALVAEHEALVLANARTIAELDEAGRRAEIAERALAAAKASAEAATCELEMFSYSVAHDLRAPLRAIEAFGRFLADDHGDKLEPEAREHLDYIRSNTKRMGDLIEALLALSRVSRAELRCEATDLGPIARAVTTELATRHPERSVDVIVGDRLQVEADPRLAHALVMGLLSNAWKFTGKVSQPRIEIGASGNPPVFFVRDNGAGFDMAYASKLFAPFQRLHSAREFPGTGIGLATVQRIVRRHGGRIWAEAAVDNGATFYFTLPTCADHASDPAPVVR